MGQIEIDDEDKRLFNVYKEARKLTQPEMFRHMLEEYRANHPIMEAPER